MNRREFLSTGVLAAAAAGATTMPALAAATSDGAPPGKRGRAFLSPSLSPAQRLDAFVRMRARTDGALSFGWLRSIRSTVIDGDVTPLCGVLAGAVCRFERKSETLVEATVLEVAHYVDPASGTLLESVTMPGTGRTVSVPRYRFGPEKVRFAPAHDEWESFEPAKSASNATQFVPRSDVHLQRSIGPIEIVDDVLHLRAEEYGRVYVDRARPPTVFYREFMTWRADAKAALDGTRASVPASYGYTALTSWRPWMQMGSLAGYTADHGYGEKAESWDACPPEFLALTRRLHPDVLDDPGAALNGARK